MSVLLSYDVPIDDVNYEIVNNRNPVPIGGTRTMTVQSSDLIEYGANV